MQSPWIHKAGKSKLTNASKPLEPRVVNDSLDSVERYGYETINRVVDYFFSLQCNSRGMVSDIMCNFKSLMNRKISFFNG